MGEWCGYFFQCFLYDKCREVIEALEYKLIRQIYVKKIVWHIFIR